MTYGYCRISTAKQSIDRQARNILSEYPDAFIVSEAFTGTTIDRPKFSKLLKAVRSGDTIVFDSVSRMARNSEEGLALYEELSGKGINLVFLREHHIDTATYQKAKTEAVPMTGTAVDCILQGVNEYLRILAREQIRLAFAQAQKEVDDLHQRTKEGILTAKIHGKKPGRRAGEAQVTKKSIAAKEIIRKHYKGFKGTLNAEETAKLAGVSRNSFFKYCRELHEEDELRDLIENQMLDDAILRNEDM